MPQIIGIPKEKAPGENRVALVPAHITNLVKAGFEVIVEKGAGLASGYIDEAYIEKGAKIVPDFATVAKSSDIIFAVRAAAANPASGKEDAAQLKEGQIYIALMDPYSPHEAFKTFAQKKVTAFSMELIPRTTRAQAMDVLSSQANLSGYKAALLAAETLPKMYPMMMTAAGTIVPSKVFVLGAGVAGLQAIATTKRLGAVVSGYDVRAAVKDQVESLGAKFVLLDIESSEGQGGYAKAMDEAYYDKQRQLLAQVIKDMDVVITTAAIPGRPSPLLVTEEAVKSMAPGSVIVDLAAERGGNCALSEAGKTVVKHGVTILAPLNLPSTIAHNASQLYSKNIITFLLNMINKEKQLVINREDDIVAATLLTYQGQAGQEKFQQTLGL